jgi:putative FmdB family regulatory protein
MMGAFCAAHFHQNPHPSSLGHNFNSLHMFQTLSAKYCTCGLIKEQIFIKLGNFCFVAIFTVKRILYDINLIKEQNLMPLYEYQCLDCTETFELRRTFAQAEQQVVCPSCEGVHTEKAFATIALLGTPQPSTDTLPMAGGGCCGGGMCGCQH